jgi:segregation and condensation protein A
VKLADRTPETNITTWGFEAPVAIEIECPAFTGPLAMLFECVRKHKVDLLGVPLQPICEAYFRYVLDHSLEDLDRAAAALVALCYLLERKAHLLIPAPEVEMDELPYEDGEWEYEPSLHEFVPAIEALRMCESERDQHYYRSGASEALYEMPYELKDVTPGDLARAFERLLKRAVPEKPEILSKPRRSLADQMDIVAAALPTEFTPLDQIITDPFTVGEAVWWFLALLELIRLGQAEVRVEGEEVLFAGKAVVVA